MVIAFYKSFSGNWLDKIIGIWTISKYSHVEIVDDCKFFYTSSPREGGVRKKLIDLEEKHWDFYLLDDSKKLEKTYCVFFNITEKCTYDWVGIFFYHFFPLNLNSKRKYYCSEWVCTLLRLCSYDLKKNNVSPGRLYEELLEKKYIKKIHPKDI